jgi:AcrR family transcriptional regulator
VILARAADIGSAEGLEGLSIGRLAAECGTSKSNVAAHFGTKERLQLAAVDYASAVFAEHVVVAALAAPAGLPRLVALYERWMTYSRRRVFSGGCFFAAVTAEYDAREGAVREALRDCRTRWVDLQQELVRQAQFAGELREDMDAAQLAFELDAFAQAANAAAVLYDDDSAYDRADTAIRARLAGLRVPSQHKDVSRS